jgi:hypothetical protein
MELVHFFIGYITEVNVIGKDYEGNDRGLLGL